MNRKIKNRFRLNRLAGENKLRLCVFRSCNHMLAQIIDRDGNVLADATSASKLCPVYKASKMEKAKWVGQEIAKKTDLANNQFYFDRGEYAYHGVVKMLADSAREAGMRF